MKPVPLTLRPYRAEDDLAALVDIWDRASRRAHAFLGEARLNAQKHQLATQWLPAAETYVAVMDDQPVGFISLLGQTVGGLFVSPDHHRQGIGQRLIARALTLRGALDLDVYADNDGARRFYAAMGFQHVGHSPRDREGLPFAIIHLGLNPTAA